MVSKKSGTIEKTEQDVLLQMQDVTFGYGKQPLFYHVALQIRRGEMVGLLGPNGSGKSTLLRLLSGVVRPQQGQVLLAGRSLARWGRRAIAQHIAVVPQELHMPFAFTVEQMVRLGRTPFTSAFFGSPSRDDDQIVQEAMQVTDVSRLRDRVFNELSGGERQRVMIAMALAQQPLVLLLDEPTSHLDIKHQSETLALVQQLHTEQQVTVVAAMHDLNLAARYFPRLLLFQRGIVADAGPTEVLEPRLLHRVYDVDTLVGILRGAGHLSVIPHNHAGSKHEQEEDVQSLVHVIAGGGSGERMMRALADARLPFIAGALNIGDSDHTLALRLAHTVITEQPYAPIALETLERVQYSLARVAFLIICPIPIGPGNLALLQAAVYAVQHGLPAVILRSPSAEHSECDRGNIKEATTESWETEAAERDYTGGEGVTLLSLLVQAGAIVVESIADALNLAKKYVFSQEGLSAPPEKS